jgi:hypothetical protein
LEVFVYAIKHDYNDLANQVAPSLICTPFEKFMDHGLPANAVVRFVSHIFSVQLASEVFY